MEKVITKGNLVIEVEYVGQHVSVYEYGKGFRTASVNLIDNGKRYNNLCVNVRSDDKGDFLDFTKTRYKQFGKVSL